MQLCAFPAADAVLPIRIGQHVERLVVFNEFVDQALCSLVVHIVIAGAVNEQQFALELRRPGDRGTLDIGFLVVRQYAGIAFLVALKATR